MYTHMYLCIVSYFFGIFEFCVGESMKHFGGQFPIADFMQLPPPTGKLSAERSGRYSVVFCGDFNWRGTCTVLPTTKSDFSQIRDQKTRLDYQDWCCEETGFLRIGHPPCLRHSLAARLPLNVGSDWVMHKQKTRTQIIQEGESGPGRV